MSTFKVLIEEKYNWILNYDFTQPSSTQTFWYRSEDKMEPRLGRCDLDVGKEKQIVLVKPRRTLLSENFHTPMGSSHCWLYAAV